MTRNPGRRRVDPTKTARVESVVPLMLLADDAILRRLTAVWPNVRSSLGVDPADPLPYPVVEEWSRLSGLARSLVEDAAPILLGNGFCIPGGRLDPRVEKFLRQRFDMLAPKKSPGGRPPRISIPAEGSREEGKGIPSRVVALRPRRPGRPRRTPAP